MKTAKIIQNWAAGILIAAVAFLTIISIFGVWDFFSNDVIAKSFQTFGILGIVSVLVMVSGKFVGGQDDPNLIIAPNPIFARIRRTTLLILIVAVVLLAFLGVCAIWNLITDIAILHKSLSSMAILAFSAFIIVLTALTREDNPRFKNHINVSTKGIIGLTILAWILFSFLM